MPMLAVTVTGRRRWPATQPLGQRCVVHEPALGPRSNWTPAGERELAAATFEEAQPEGCLEGLDLATDGGLGEAQRRGRTGEG